LKETQKNDEVADSAQEAESLSNKAKELAERIRQDLASTGKNLDEYNRVKELHQKTTQRLGSVIGDDSTEKEEKNVVSDLEREQKEVKKIDEER